MTSFQSVAGAALICLSFAVDALAEPLVFAAASTKKALDAAIEATDLDATVSYAASGALARQIVAGAPADLFLSANPQWMDFLIDQGLVSADAPAALLSNRLVLIAPAGPPAEAVDLTPTAITAALGEDRFVMPHPESSPLGRYGQSALETLGLWSAVAPQFAPMKDAPATVAIVARGEAALGLSYATDAAGVAEVRVVADVPADAHPPILYLLTTLDAGGDKAAAEELIAALSSPDAIAAFEAHGFTAVTEGDQP